MQHKNHVLFFLWRRYHRLFNNHFLLLCLLFCQICATQTKTHSLQTTNIKWGEKRLELDKKKLSTGFLKFLLKLVKQALSQRCRWKPTWGMQTECNLLAVIVMFAQEISPPTRNEFKWKLKIQFAFETEISALLLPSCRRLFRLPQKFADTNRNEKFIDSKLKALLLPDRIHVASMLSQCSILACLTYDSSSVTQVEDISWNKIKTNICSFMSALYVCIGWKRLRSNE